MAPYGRSVIKMILKSTLVVTNPLKCQLIQPPMTIMGRTLVKLPFSMSVIIEGSVIGFGAGAARAYRRKKYFIQDFNIDQIVKKT
jgi:hypothetical protein